MHDWCMHHPLLTFILVAMAIVAVEGTISNIVEFLKYKETKDVLRRARDD